ncbi:MAG: type I-C CRISPR-associated protein Cas8c/Csd1, partial [Leptospiraceae bacterium]|nr:type I-C CRISPR-associated protein Cas8c/Csd1 [Leptospiraceae bacterium]
YYTGTVGDIARNLHQHFEDLQLKGSPTDRSYPSLDHLMRATAVRGERERIHPLLAAQCIQAILSGGLYPRILLSATLSRLAHDHDSHSRHYYDHARCALIKASLNRMRARRPEYCNFEEVQETMDESNMNTEYRLGRLFAVLEHVQRKALGLEINRTIRDRYFSSAATRPAQVFPVIVNLAQHHLSKLKHKGNQIYFEKIIQNILEPVKEYPHGNVSLEGQGLFTLGYYHQKQDLFKKKESGEEVEEEQEQED